MRRVGPNKSTPYFSFFFGACRREEISRGDLDEVDSLFHDAKFSARLLAEQADKYIS